jgi:putative transposase
LRCARAKADVTLMPKIQQVWQNNLQVHGADKVWHQLKSGGGLRPVELLSGS